MSLNTLEPESSHQNIQPETGQQIVDLEDARAQAVGSIITAVEWATSITGQPPHAIWEDHEVARRQYTRVLSDEVNHTLADHETTGDDIAYTIVAALTNETQKRWQGYTSFIEAAAIDEQFTQYLAEESIALDWLTKYEEIAKSWARFIDGYGVPGVEYAPSVRAEFISNKITWDISKEKQLLSRALQTETPAA